jgi:signal transduction histidine kinase
VSILRKLILAVVLAAAASVAVFQIVLYTSAGGMLRQVLGRRQQDAAGHLMSRIDDTLNNATLDVHAIAESSDLEEWLTAVPIPRPSDGVVQELREFQVTTGPWENIKVLDANGVVLFSETPAEIGRRTALPHEQAAVAEARAMRSYISPNVVLSPEFNRPTLIFAAPVFTDPPRHEVLGTVVAYYGWPTITDILDSSRSRVRLLDASGAVIAAKSSERAAVLRERVTNRAVLQAAAARRPALLSWDRDGESFVVNYVPQRGSLSFSPRGWGLLQESTVAEVYQPLNAMVWRIAGATFGFLLLFAAAIAWTARRLMRPIGRLTEAAQRVSAGDLSARAEVRGRDELGVLAASFNTMLGSLHEEIEGRRIAERLVDAERQALAERVTERTAELQAANIQLLEAGKVKDEFLANMSHELRTPLNAILGLSEALSDGMYGPLDDDKAAAIRTIEESGRHLLSLINDVLDMAKIEAGMLEIERDPVSVDALCHASVALLREAALRKTVALRYGGCNGENCIVMGDFRRLKQVLVNLLSNAVKFTPGGGAVQLDVDAADGVVRLIVHDTGIGIAEDDFDRLFRPFVQIDSGLARVHEGTGLGLALVAKLVDMHGGSVSVESEPGKGSRFTVTLPGGARRAVDPAAEGQMPAARLDGLRVLVVDDNETNADLVVRYLRNHGAEVGVARDGVEAVTMAAAGGWNAVLMDIQMPRMDGITATRTIREYLSREQLPIIATTSFAMAHDRRRALEAGMNDYMAKPLRLKELTRLIASLTAHPA